MELMKRDGMRLILIELFERRAAGHNQILLTESKN